MALAFVGRPAAVHADGPRGTTSDELRLTISAFPGNRSHERPWLLVTLVNRGDRDVWVSRRMALNGPDAPDPYRDLWLEVRDIEGRPVVFMCAVRIGSASHRHYIRLEPGKAIGQLLDLASCYSVVPGKRYEIVAHWHDMGPESEKPAKGALKTNGELQASLTLDY
jgi:hypothetical protein